MPWKCTDEFGDAWLHRPLAALVVRGVRSTRVHPDHLTLLGCGLGLCAAFYLGLGSPWAAPLLILSLVFDCADGQLARLRGPTKWGRWLDGVSDTTVGVALHVGLLGAGVPLWVVALSGAFTFVQGMVVDGMKMLYQGAQDIPLYTRIQRRMVGAAPVSARFMRAVGLTGPTTHWVLLAVCAALGSFDAYFVYSLGLSNLLLLLLMGRRHLEAARLAAGRP